MQEIRDLSWRSQHNAPLLTKQMTKQMLELLQDAQVHFINDSADLIECISSEISIIQLWLQVISSKSFRFSAFKEQIP